MFQTQFQVRGLDSAKFFSFLYKLYTSSQFNSLSAYVHSQVKAVDHGRVKQIKSQDAVAQWLTLFKASNSTKRCHTKVQPDDRELAEAAMCRWMGSMGDPILMGNSWKNVADFFDFSARSGDLSSLQHRPCQRRGWKNSRGLSWLGWLHMT